MPKNFFELSDSEADDIVAARFSLPTDMKRKAPVKRGAKKPSVKRVSAKRGSARRGSAKRGSAKRVSVKRGSRRRTSRPLVGMFARQSIPRPAVAEPGRNAHAERVASGAREAARAMLAVYVRWIEGDDPGKWYTNIVTAADLTRRASDMAYAETRMLAGVRGMEDVSKVLTASAIAGNAAATLGDHVIQFARAHRFPDERERKQLHEVFYVRAGETLQHAYNALRGGVVSPGSQDVPQPMVALPPMKEKRTDDVGPRKSVEEMVDELGGLRMEERLRGLGGASKDAVDLGPPPSKPPDLIRKRVGDETKMARGWTELLKFVPHTVNQLGIARAVRDGTFAHRWLGSGAYATAFSLPDSGYVLKLTTDPEDAFISMKLAEASQKGEPPNGLIRTYVVFRIGLPFRIETKLSGRVDTVYGMVTERAITLTDYAKKENSLREPLIEKAMREGKIDRLKADRLLRETYQEANRVVSDALNEFYSKNTVFEEYLATVIGQPTQVVEDFREGIEWCTARGLKFGADAHQGNFAIVWRNGRFEAVKSDLGHYSVEKGRGFAIDGASRLPLAANNSDEEGTT